MRERAQDMMHIWRTDMMPLHDQSPQAEYKRSLEEVGELGQAIEVFDGTDVAKLNVAQEAADVVIRMLGVVDSVGYDLASLVREKIVFTTQRKYPTSAVKARMKDGLDWNEAMGHQKAWSERWNKHT